MNNRKNANPENVIKRKSYYGFAKRYPGTAGDGKYLIGDSLKVKRGEAAKRILTAVVLALLFAAAYIVTAAALLISNASV